MQRQANPSSFRLTRSQIEMIDRRSAETGIPKNRIVRWAIDSYFRSDRAA